MTVTMSGSAVIYNDGSSDTSNTFGMTATASGGGVGTYALMQNNSGVNLTIGNTVAGSSLTFCSSWGTTNSGVAGSGTWRCMGYSRSYGAPDMVSLYVRIS